MTTSMFEKYGGVPSVKVVVNDFYAQMLSKPNLKRYFADTDMDRLALHQIEFIAFALGKPKAFYEDQRLLDAHRHLQITDSSFNQTVEILKAVLEKAGFEPDDLQAVLRVVETKRHLIVKR